MARGRLYPTSPIRCSQAEAVTAPGFVAEEPVRGFWYPGSVRDHDTMALMRCEPFTASDAAAAAEQLGREMRGVVGVAWRCPCGRPGVLATMPRLPNGTPFPTSYYMTCQHVIRAVSRLEATGVMAEMTARLATDPELAGAYRRAHEAYLANRRELAAQLGEEVPEIEGVSAGGMPTRVKCLHALVAHSLAVGPGVNPIGDEALGMLGEFWAEEESDD